MTTTTTTSATLYRTIIDTPVGPLTLIASDRGLRAVLWMNDRDTKVEIAHAGGPADGGEHDPNGFLDIAVAQLEEYFAGTRTDFDIPLDTVGTGFQRTAWDALCTIPYGETVSYGEQARRMGDVRKARAVGAANGRNPVSIIVPCHRVVGADGSLTGFGGGLEAKAWLLDHERRVWMANNAIG